MYNIKAAGIYLIEIGDYYYLGMSVDIFSRWKSHYTSLKLNKHHSPKLQEMFNEFGLEGMSFKVLEYISITEFKKESKKKGKALTDEFRKHLLKKEKQWMSNYSINFSLNASNKNFG